MDSKGVFVQLHLKLLPAQAFMSFVFACVSRRRGDAAKRSAHPFKDTALRTTWASCRRSLANTAATAAFSLILPMFGGDSEDEDDEEDPATPWQMPHIKSIYWHELAASVKMSQNETVCRCLKRQRVLSYVNYESQGMTDMGKY